MNAALISVDWGTTTLRCALVSDDGKVLKRKVSQQGILKTDGAAFADILHGKIEPWLAEFQAPRPVPIMMSGMIGSRQGWQEAPYVERPASIDELAGRLLHVYAAGSPLGGCDIRIVPGMFIPGHDELGQIPDVMRGEESQVFGALIGTGKVDGIFVAPGTHSKWVVVENREIIHFETYMTGEIFAALFSATILGKLAEGDAYDHESFVAGAELAITASELNGQPGTLLNLVFSARSGVLLGGMKPTAVRSYLSGLLIGAEFAAGLATSSLLLEEDAYAEGGRILADEPLLSRYRTVAELAEFSLMPVQDDPVAAAHLAIARLAGLVA